MFENKLEMHLLTIFEIKVFIYTKIYIIIFKIIFIQNISIIVNNC